MFRLKNAARLSAFALLTLSASSNAAVIDFNGLGGTDIPGNTGFNAQYTVSTSHMTIGGYRFAGSQLYVFSPLWNASNGGDAGQFSHNGTHYMGTAGALVMTSLTSPFSIAGLDLKSWAHNEEMTTVELSGVYAAGGTHSATITLNPTFNGQIVNGNDFSNYVLSGFTGLSSFTIKGNTVAHLLALDNIDVSATAAAVPEPGTVAVFGLGLVALATLRRRKQQ